ncbi:uncharacterized protein LOC144002907, partial [Festucalex cinctus]
VASPQYRLTLCTSLCVLLFIGRLLWKCLDLVLQPRRSATSFCRKPKQIPLGFSAGNLPGGLTCFHNARNAKGGHYGDRVAVCTKRNAAGFHAEGYHRAGGGKSHHEPVFWIFSRLGLKTLSGPFTSRCFVVARLKPPRCRSRGATKASKPAAAQRGRLERLAGIRAPLLRRRAAAAPPLRSSGSPPLCRRSRFPPSLLRRLHRTRTRQSSWFADTMPVV